MATQIDPRLKKYFKRWHDIAKVKAEEKAIDDAVCNIQTEVHYTINKIISEMSEIEDTYETFEVSNEVLKHTDYAFDTTLVREAFESAKKTKKLFKMLRDEVDHIGFTGDS
jgi:uncharacterized protein YktA (UPF0223 family)